MSELNPEGVAAARRAAGWYIGDRYWADLVLRAYNNPEETNAALDKEMEA